jgi:hypothetical protein
VELTEPQRSELHPTPHDVRPHRRRYFFSRVTGVTSPPIVIYRSACPDMDKRSDMWITLAEGSTFGVDNFVDNPVCALWITFALTERREWLNGRTAPGRYVIPPPPAGGVVT